MIQSDEPIDSGMQSEQFLGIAEQMRTEQLTDAQKQKIREMAEQSLYFFAKFVLGYSRIVPHIHKPMCDMLQDFEANRRLMCIIPRGWFKTTIFSIAYPLWRASKDPNLSILIVQNTSTNAEAKLKSLGQHVIANPVYRGLFPEVLPDKTCPWRSDSLQLKRTVSSPEGTFEALGIRGQATSRHYNIIIQDDTVAPDLNELGEENVAPTKDDIGQAIGYHKLCPPLLRKQSTDQIIVVGTRWFPKDLLQYIMDNQAKDYRMYIRACRENEQGQADINGRLTFPEEFGEEVLAELESAMGPYLFRCLYLNMPVRSGDMIFEPEWFTYWDTHPGNLRIYTTVDPAGDPTETIGENDYNVVMTCGVDTRTGLIYVLNYTRKKMSPFELIEELFRHVDIYKPEVVGVETIAYQNTLVSHIKDAQKKANRYFTVKNLTHGKRAKNARIQGLQPLVFNGRLKFQTWMTALINELTSFPLSKHDDLADALSMQLVFWAQHQPPKKDPTVVEEDPFDFDPDKMKKSIRQGKINAGLITEQAYNCDMLGDQEIIKQSPWN